MDDFISSFLSQPSWPDTSLLPWDGGILVSQINSLLGDSVDADQEDRKNPPSHVNEIAAAEDFFDMHGYDGTCIRSSHVNEVVVCDCNTAFKSAMPPESLTISSAIERDFKDLPSFPPPLSDAQSVVSVSDTWYSNVSSCMKQENLHGIGFQGAECDGDILNGTCLENGNFTHLDSAATVLLDPTDNVDFQGTVFPYFSSGEEISLPAETLQPPKDESKMNNMYPSPFPSGETPSSRTTGIVTLYQISGSQSQQINTTTNGCSVAMKPRARARRGQATDPHSIAERLRRERITDRMKNLQELIPNSKKTDKASMLDEIIDYVKFLQLQVKVLSMSRLEAVVPLLTDAQDEGSGTLILPSSAEALNLFDSDDNLAFEQEVVKLMETNVTAAMQYLQDKGLCLMPISLAAAISNQKGSSSAAIPPERMKASVTYGAI
ncbi:uncharacterized protein LOC141823603 [Curcuma longa]|uniref:uncharacterized protein LOC141823603 n=1 Tax=Curcuma longa TaxID=136217 RepID=UPI003D9F97C6